jgi:hypothetical protein
MRPAKVWRALPAARMSSQPIQRESTVLAESPPTFIPSIAGQLTIL